MVQTSFSELWDNWERIVNAAYKWCTMLGLQNGFSIGRFCVIYRSLLYYTAVLYRIVECKNGVRVVGENIFNEHVDLTIFEPNINKFIGY